jgi:hypothetical protein
MSQFDIDDFVESVEDRRLTTGCVTTAVAIWGIAVNGRQRSGGRTALHLAVDRKRYELCVALLAVGADPNVKSNTGATSVWVGASRTADILQLLIDAGGDVNVHSDRSGTPLISHAISSSYDDEAAVLGVIFSCPDLKFDSKYKGKTAEQWATERGCFWKASAIADERARRARWGVLRSAWITATITRHSVMES